MRDSKDSTLRVGLIALASFPLTSGVEFKIRPVVLLASEDWASLDALVLVASVTSSDARIHDPELVVLRDWAQLGLNQPSGVQTHRLFTTQGRFIHNELGAIAGADLIAIQERVLRFVSGDEQGDRSAN